MSRSVGRSGSRAVSRSESEHNANRLLAGLYGREPLSQVD